MRRKPVWVLRSWAAWLLRRLTRRAARDSDVVVATYDELAGFGLEDLAGKTLISSSVTDEQLAELASRGVDLVIDSTPQPFDCTVSAAMLTWTARRSHNAASLRPRAASAILRLRPNRSISQLASKPARNVLNSMPGAAKPPPPDAAPPPGGAGIAFSLIR